MKEGYVGIGVDLEFRYMYSVSGISLSCGESSPVQEDSGLTNNLFLGICRITNWNQRSPRRDLVNDPVGVVLSVSMSMQWP
jgi:hypothetical protein